MEINVIDLSYFFSGIYSLILILIGTPLNLLCFYIFTRLVPNRSNPTIIVFAHLALIELLIPFTWNINYVVRELLWKFQENSSSKNLEQHSLLLCKFISFGAYFSLQCAAWLKTLATIARCVTLHHHWSLKKWLSKPTIIRRTIWIVIVLIAVINAPVWIVNGKRHLSIDQSNREQLQIKCYQSRFFQFWEVVHLLLYNFIPFTLMILFNLMIIRHVRASRQRTQGSKMRSPSMPTSSTHRRSKSNDGGRLTKALIFITIFFILFTAPAAIFYIVFGNKVKRHRDLITMSLSNLATTSHVTSCIIYWLTSNDFKDAAMSVLFCRPMLLPHRSTADEKHVDRCNSPQQLPLTPVIIRANDEIQLTSPCHVQKATTTE
jgi:hypothetical protein